MNDDEPYTGWSFVYGKFEPIKDYSAFNLWETLNEYACDIALTACEIEKRKATKPTVVTLGADQAWHYQPNEK